MDQQSKPTLPDDVAAKFELRVVTCGTYHFPGFGNIDLSKLTVESAQALVDRKFPYLAAKSSAAAAPAASAVKVKAASADGGDNNNPPK